MTADAPPFPISTVSFRPADPAPPGCFETLRPEVGRTVRILANYLHRGKCHGEEMQRWIAKWLFRFQPADPPGPSGPLEDSLISWLRDSRPAISFSRRRFDLALRAVDEPEAKTTRVLHRPFGTREPDTPESPCPVVLFETGPERAEITRVAFLNSRKPRDVRPDEPWLRALRRLLDTIEADGAALVTSFGTLVYDLAAARAIQARLPATFVLPDGFGALPSWVSEVVRETPGAELTTATCLLSNNACPKTKRLGCRDRIVALLSNAQVLLDVRPGGNLASAVELRQDAAPSRLYVLAPTDSASINLGGMELAARYGDRATFFLPPEPAQAVSALIGEIERRPSPGEFPEDPRWDDYLYHYTRAFPSTPWPGESRGDYLAGLLRGDPESGHRALDTLIRILREEKIRASSRLIPGDLAAVSWTAIPPHDLQAIRRWNQGLMRWTFEPYGIAVSRRLLKAAGAKPVIYGGRNTAARLRPEDLYRHQLHEPASAPWKREREWRLAGDFLIRALPESEAFLFVPTEADAGKVATSGVCRFPARVVPRGDAHPTELA